MALEISGAASSVVQGGMDQLCQELVACVTKSLDPLCPQTERGACYQTIENFKEHSPQCLPCGFQLAQEQGPVIRHFGLQLLEHFVRYRWNSLKKVERKEFTLQLLQYMSFKVLPSDLEVGYVKEGIARVVMETVKRMWPQQWPKFLADLDTLTRCGPTQVELVLLILRRLAEDVHLSYDSGLTPQRRKQMAATLSENSESLFTFLLNTFESPPAPHLLSTALAAVTSFVEWLDFKVLLMRDCRLLELLYSLIGSEELKTAACECLLVILARKGEVRRTAEERMKLLMLLSRDALNVIFQASKQANSAGVDSEQYVFLKRVCQVLLHLGTSQLAPLWGTSFIKPEGFQTNFELYLQVVLEFTRHQSQILSMTSAEVWSHFVSHIQIKEDPVFRACLPSLLSVIRERLMKLGDPTQSSHISSEYSRMDFDVIHEYNTFFSRYRGLMTRLVHNISLLVPETTAQEALDTVQRLVQLPQPETELTKFSMLYLEWDGFVSFLECWTSTFKTESSQKEAVKEKALAVITHLLAYQSQDPLLLSCQFRCLQTGLTLFLEFDHQILQAYLNKIFSSLRMFGNDPVKREVNVARTLIATCFVHVCESQEGLLAPFLQELYKQYQALVGSNVLSYSEKCAFTEALIILSQSLLQSDLKQQSIFIGELLQETKLLISEVQSAVASVEALVDYLGLKKHPGSDPTYDRKRRSHLWYIIHIVLVILKRSPAWTTLHSKEGGALVPPDPQQCPSYQHVMPVIVRVIFPLNNTLYQLWSEKSKPLLSEYFQKLSDLHQLEKDGVMGHSQQHHPEHVREEIECLQINLNAVHDGCLQTISRAYTVYSCQHMQEIGFVDATLQALFTNAAEINSWRMKPLIRCFFLYLVNSCPEECWDGVLIPILTHACHLIFTKLRDTWNIIVQRQPAVTTGDDEEVVDDMGSDTEVSQEVLEEQLVIALSREYTHMLEVICARRDSVSHNKVRQGQEKSEPMMDEDMEDCSLAAALPEEQPTNRWSPYQTLTPLGVKLLEAQPLNELLFMSAFGGLSWNDTQTATKCTNIAGLLFEKAPKGSFSAEVYTQLFSQVLIGLQKHGMHDNNRNELLRLALMIYQTTRKQCPGILNILAQLPGNSSGKVQAFNSLLEQKKPPSVKQKREKFKELLSGIIGKHIGEAFKRPPAVFDLPELAFKKKAKESTQIVTDLSSLFQDSADV